MDNASRLSRATFRHAARPDSAEKPGIRGKSVAIDGAGSTVAAGSFDQSIDLGAGPLSALAGTPDYEGTMFVAKYAQEPSVPPLDDGGACPLGVDAGSGFDGGTLVTALVGESPEIALGASAVYWSTGTEILAQGFDGGEPQLLAFDQKNITAVAIDGQSLYWANAGTFYGTYPGAGPGTDGQILSLPLSGGAVTPLAEGLSAPHAIAVDDAGVYWTGGGADMLADGGISIGQVMTVPLQGGSPRVLVSGLRQAGAPAVHDGVAVFPYFMSGGASGTGGAIARAPVAGGPLTVLATDDRTVTSIVFDDTTVYWTDSVSVNVDVSYADARLQSVPLGGGSASILLSNQAAPGNLVLLDSTLFFANGGTFSNVSSGHNAAIWSLPAGNDGAAATDLLNAPSSVGALALDRAHLAWSENVDPFDGLWVYSSSLAPAREATGLARLRSASTAGEGKPRRPPDNRTTGERRYGPGCNRTALWGKPPSALPRRRLWRRTRRGGSSMNPWKRRRSSSSPRRSSIPCSTEVGKCSREPRWECRSRRERRPDNTPRPRPRSADRWHPSPRRQRVLSHSTIPWLPPAQYPRPTTPSSRSRSPWPPCCLPRTTTPIRSRSIPRWRSPCSPLRRRRSTPSSRRSSSRSRTR